MASEAKPGPLPGPNFYLPAAAEEYQYQFEAAASEPRLSVPGDPGRGPGHWYATVTRLTVASGCPAVPGPPRGRAADHCDGTTAAATACLGQDPLAFRRGRGAGPIGCRRSR